MSSEHVAEARGDRGPPVADPASPWLAHLELAHALAHVAARSIHEEFEPNLHLEPAARLLEEALSAMYDAFDGRSDRPTAVALARVYLWEAAILVSRGGLPRALTALRKACDALISAEERSSQVALARRAPVELVAGDELPRFHTVERRSLRPTFRAPPLAEAEPEPPVLALPEPTTFAELAAVAALTRQAAEKRTAALVASLAAEPRKATEKKEPIPPAEPPSGFAFAPSPPMLEDDFIRRWARSCIDEIGMIGLQRAPLPGDSFRASLPLEKRLVTALDALAALGPVALAHVEPYGLDAPAADPMRIFAVTLIGACFEGRDFLGSAERVLHRFGAGDPSVVAAFASALRLGANPFIPNMLRTLLATKDPACRAIAVEVLAERGALTPEELAALVDGGDARLLALALPALVAGRDRNLERALVQALEDENPEVQGAALDAMALAAHPRAAAAAREAAAGALGDRALLRLAVVGDEDDARWLLQRVRASPTPAAVEAVGWAGLVEAVPALIDLLDGDAEEVKLAAGAALDRILGANLIDTIEVWPEALEEDEIEDPDPEPPPPGLAALVSDPDDLPSAGSPETLEVPSIDPVRWQDYWAKHGGRHDPKLRWRRGHPYSPSVSVYELDRLPLGAEDRRRLHRELAARTGKLTRFDPHDFVRVQEKSLQAWEALVGETVETPGGWGRPRGR